MKILLYVDPYVDISDKPEFKAVWFKDFLQNSIANLYNYSAVEGNNLEIKVLYPNILDDSHIKKEFAFIEFFSINQSEIKNIFISFNEYLSLQRANQNNDKFEQLNQIIVDKLQNFVPDIIILISSSAGYLKYAFPNSLIFFTESGLFNQVPFSGCQYFDCCPVMSESFLLKHKDEILSVNLNQDEQKFLSQVRNFFLESISEHNSYKKGVAGLRKDFDHVILLSLQVFDSPMFITQANFRDQIEYIKYVLDNVDSNIAVIVTEHYKDRILGFKPIYNYFKNNYKNFIYWPETASVGNSSQFLLELVDGIITVSSTVGLQALLHKKPLFVPSEISYLTTFCDGQDLTKIADFLKRAQYQNKDGALYYLISRYYVVGQYYKNGKWFYNFLLNSLESFRKGVDFSFYNKIDDDRSLLDAVCQQKYVDYLDEKNKKKVFKRLKNSIGKRLKKFIKNRYF
jgi:hypothetical protein